MFLTKISQMVLIPWFFSSFIILGGSLISLGRFDVFFIGTFFLLLLATLTSKILSLIKKEGESFSLGVMAQTFILSNFILFAIGISFIFFRQDSSYRKVGVGAK